MMVVIGSKMDNKKELLDTIEDIINILKSRNDNEIALNLLHKLYNSYNIEYEEKLFNRASELLIDSRYIRIEIQNIIDELLRILKDKLDDREE